MDKQRLKGPLKKLTGRNLLIKSSEVLSRTLRGCFVFGGCALLNLATAPNAHGVTTGPYKTATGQYKLAPQLDKEVLATGKTELWARVFWPQTQLKQNPLLVLLHGNHPTCGSGSGPRVDSDCSYTTTGTCPSGERVVPNHEGYNYAANLLASWGYIVVSINSNLGINCGTGSDDDNGLVLARGRLVLRHLQRWYQWTSKASAPRSLGVSSKTWLNAIDFSNVGFMGHSRGGEGMRAAYNLYQDPGSPWPARIPGLNVKAIFEIGAVDGQSTRVLDADNTAWLQILPTCDGDVSDLQGRLPFERMIVKTKEAKPSPKSLFMIWGANHNFFNSEWQVSDTQECNGYPGIYGDGPTSLKQQTLAAESMSSFFREHVGAHPDPVMGNYFDPLHSLPLSVTSITKVDRDYARTFDEVFEVRLDDFNTASGMNSHGVANEASGITVSNDDTELPKHAQVTWTTAHSDGFFQSNWTLPDQGVDVSDFATFDFRIGLPNTLASVQRAVDFDIQLVADNGSLSPKVPLTRFTDLRGPANDITSIYETVRIPLSSFNGFSLKSIRGVRFTFDLTQAGTVNFANLRFSTLADPASLQLSLSALKSQVPASQTSVGFDRQSPVAHFRKQNRTVVPPSETTDMMVATAVLVQARRNTREWSNHTAKPVTELVIRSEDPFPVLDQLPVLSMAGRDFRLSGYQNGDLKTLIFYVPTESLRRLPQTGKMTVTYGTAFSNHGRTPNKIWRLENYQLSQLVQ